jgi:hypothetical protein
LSILEGIERSGYHLTLSYFWVQLVTYHMAVEAKELHGAQAKASNTPVLVTVFGAFGRSGAVPAGEEFTLEQLQQCTESDHSLALGGAMPFADFMLRPHCQPLRNALLYSK